MTKMMEKKGNLVLPSTGFPFTDILPFRLKYR